MGSSAVTLTEGELGPVGQFPLWILTLSSGSTSMMTIKWEWQFPRGALARRRLNPWLLTLAFCWASMVEVKCRSAEKMVLVCCWPFTGSILYDNEEAESINYSNVRSPKKMLRGSQRQKEKTGNEKVEDAKLSL